MVKESFRERARDVYERRGLAKGVRHLSFISVLTLQGKTVDLRDSLAWALERRVPLNDIREAILQACLFAGFPRAIHAFEVLDAVLTEKGIEEVHPRDRTPPRTSLRSFFRRRGRELFGGDTDAGAEISSDSARRPSPSTAGLLRSAPPRESISRSTRAAWSSIWRRSASLSLRLSCA